MFGSATIPKTQPAPFPHSHYPLYDDDRTMSILERLAMDSLDRTGISYFYNKFYFPIEIDEQKVSYTPDFILGAKHDGRQVLLEMHGSALFNSDDLRKFAAFKESEYRKYYYLIVATTVRPGEPNKAKINMHTHGLDERKIADEVWYLLDLREDSMPYRGLTKPVSLGEQLDRKLYNIQGVDADGINYERDSGWPGVWLRTLASQ